MDPSAASVPDAITRAREDFYRRIDGSNLTPLWTVMGALITPEPRSPCVPFRWRFSDIRTAMMEAGGLITAKEAERRVLILENPGLRGQSKITTSLYAGVQLVTPGEVAPSHRHSQSALRFVLEGAGGHTSVDGERTTMRFGDFILTPSMTWHDHGNETSEPMFWLDGLDIPLVQFLDASFVEHLGTDAQALGKPEGYSLSRYGANLLPVDEPRRSLNSPIFNYPYERCREAIAKQSWAADLDICHGTKMRYTNPQTGGDALPTIGAFLQCLPAGFYSAPYRSTDATVFVCAEGGGTSEIGGTTVDWGPRDIFVVPSWQPVRHKATSESILFSYSDRPVQEKLGLWRELRGNA
jgi:gentisate 1,2-dioxygenase